MISLQMWCVCVEGMRVVCNMKYIYPNALQFFLLCNLIGVILSDYLSIQSNHIIEVCQLADQTSHVLSSLNAHTRIIRFVNGLLIHIRKTFSRTRCSLLFDCDLLLDCSLLVFFGLLNDCSLLFGCDLLGHYGLLNGCDLLLGCSLLVGCGLLDGCGLLVSCCLLLGCS